MDILSPLTVKDITKELGVSTATVSRALKDNPNIDKEQWEKIQVYAREHNFYSNVITESLCNSKVRPLRVIGAIIPQLSHFYFSSILSGIEEEASARDYRIMVARSNEKYDRKVRICRDYSENKVCGVVVSQAKDTIRHEHFQKLINHGMPLVFYDRICMDAECSGAVIDDCMGASNAVTYFIQASCRHIAYYGTLTTMEISKGRHNGYRDAIIKYRLKADDRFFRICDNHADAELITPEPPDQEEAPDTFLAVNDDTAVGILYAVERMGYRVPENISICGLTNGDRTKACNPMLIAVEQRGVWTGKEAANILISRVGSFIPLNKIEKRIVRTKLIIRGTAK